MARPMIKEACMASLLLENPYYILLWKTGFLGSFQCFLHRVETHRMGHEVEHNKTCYCYTF